MLKLGMKLRAIRTEYTYAAATKSLITQGKEYPVTRITSYGTATQYAHFVDDTGMDNMIPDDNISGYFVIVEDSPAKATSCTCGSAAVRSHIHSNWCDLASVA